MEANEKLSIINCIHSYKALIYLDICTSAENSYQSLEDWIPILENHTPVSGLCLMGRSASGFHIRRLCNASLSLWHQMKRSSFVSADSQCLEHKRGMTKHGVFICPCMFFVYYTLTCSKNLNHLKTSSCLKPKVPKVDICLSVLTEYE